MGQRCFGLMYGCQTELDWHELYGGEIELVKERWRIFAAWCAEQGHALGEPELFLMETETT